MDGNVQLPLSDDDRLRRIEQRLDELDHKTSLLITLFGSKIHNEESESSAPQIALLGATYKGKDFSTSMLDQGSMPKEVVNQLDPMVLRIDSYRHRWWADVFNTNPHTEFVGRAFVINKNNGKIYTWNLIETSSDNNCNIPPTKLHYYKKFQNAQYGEFGFGIIPGESRHVSAWLKFYADWGVLRGLVQTKGCPPA